VTAWWAGWTWLLRTVVVAFSYFALAKAALTLASLHPNASPVWPPSGLALASLLLWGNRLWPAIAAGAFLASVTTFGSPFTSFCIAGGNTLEGLITALLLKRLTRWTNTFDTPLQVVLFAGLALGPGTMVSATVGVGSLVLAGFAEPAKFVSIWLTWWLGDVGGQMIVTPFIVLWFKNGFREVDCIQVLRLALLLAATIIIGLLAFSPLNQQTNVRGPLAFLAIGPLLWSALQHDQRDTATVAFVLCAFAIWGAVSNGGLFARPNPNDSFLVAMAFAISATVPSLVLSADVAVRRQSEAHKNLLIAELDHRVKNALATVIAVVSQTRQESRSVATFAEALEARIRSMAATQELLSSSRWQGISLAEIVRRELAPYTTRSNIEINGPHITLKSEAGQAMATVLHELATNAAKYGALSTEKGRVSIRWDQRSSGHSSSRLVFEWQEMGGPPVEAPGKPSYGTTTICELIPYEFGGTVDLVFAPEGVSCRLELPPDWLTNMGEPTELVVDTAR